MQQKYAQKESQIKRGEWMDHQEKESKRLLDALTVESSAYTSSEPPIMQISKGVTPNQRSMSFVTTMLCVLLAGRRIDRLRC